MKTFCYWFHTHPLGGKADSVVKLWSESQKHRPSEKQHLPDYHLLLVYPLPWRRASQPWPWRRWTSLWGLLHQRIHWTRFSQDYEYSDDDDNEEIVYEYEYEEEEAPLTTLTMEVEEHEDYEEEPAIRQKTKEWKMDPSLSSSSFEENLSRFLSFFFFLPQSFHKIIAAG